MARGGARSGAGRPKGSVDEKKRQVREIAATHSASMINILVKIAQNPKKPDNIRILAAREVLDRGTGKPRQEIDATVSRGHEEWLELMEKLVPEGG
ncbi:hypothetical protein VSS37_03830 [Candidatus Thiothrix sp. Deng01]|uniref:Uncharacterized protein n=1 Tax=Candidatus Thiothrix phosphatis TaxID=3112415 RepID=A0ABU6CTF4_9GAMM|nr:hypothetical protein [Candidatus Thiothrix sp. Deng01]MEB4590101.1 hypothetical protein [Candidatus Thiothrix sp. Deng01]